MEIVVRNDIKYREKVLRLSYTQISGKECVSIYDIPPKIFAHLISIGHENLVRPFIIKDLQKYKRDTGHNKQGRKTIAERWGTSHHIVRGIGRQIGVYSR